MTLANVQVLLARLYTEPHLLQQLQSEPTNVAAEFGLVRQEALEIATVSEQQLTVFADSLVRKRSREVRKLLPLTSELLAHRFDGYFGQHTQNYRLQPPNPHLQDAIAFCKFMRAKKGIKSVRPLTAQIVQHELRQLTATLHACGTPFGWFRQR